MTERLQINVDLTDHPELFKKIGKIAKKLDTDKSKFVRFALRKVVSEIENDKSVVELGIRETAVTSDK